MAKMHFSLNRHSWDQLVFGFGEKGGIGELDLTSIKFAQKIKITF